VSESNKRHCAGTVQSHGVGIQITVVATTRISSINSNILPLHVGILSLKYSHRIIQAGFPLIIFFTSNNLNT